MKLPTLPTLKTLAKYFIHGIAFSVLSLIVTLFSALLLGFLILIGAFIGLIIGFAILVILIGVINTFITEMLWFGLETSWTKYLYQGIILLIVFGIVGLPLGYLNSQATHLPALYSILAVAILFIVESPIYGYLGKRVASIWQRPEPGVPSIFRTLPPQTQTASPQAAPTKPAVTGTASIGPVNPEALKREEAKLDLLLEHRKRTDLLNPEALDHQIEIQKRTVETLRQAMAAGNP